MSKLDSLLGMADALAARSDKLVSSINESNSLISLIIALNTSISRYDSEIDSMSQLVAQNNAFLVEFQKLYERSFFLESNFGLSDCRTNDTSFSNLYNEYDFLWNEFHVANSKWGSSGSSSTVRTDTRRGHSHENQEQQEQQAPPGREVKNVSSISNLTLKPLRCGDSKISKQKSRYRLLEAYTWNPLRDLPVREESSQHTQYTNIMDTLAPDLHKNSSFSTVTGLPLFDSHDEQLTRTPPFLEAEEAEPSEQESTLEQPSLALLFKSLYAPAYDTAATGNTADVDGMESLGLESISSPDSRFEDFDNFHHFLRQSRVNLKDSFPANLRRSSSSGSVLTGRKSSSPPPSASASAFLLETPIPHKFHNPAAMISHNTSLSTQSTVEAIYSQSCDAASNFKEHSTKLLASQNDKPQNFDLSKLMNSPLGSPLGLVRSRTPLNNQNERNVETSCTSPGCKIPVRRNSVDLFGKSLASSFMRLVNTSSSLPTGVPVIPAPNETMASTSPPEKIKKLKKDLKNPIALKNEIKSKRLPPIDRQPRNDRSSSLTIGQNKTKIINHGETSVFKNPRSKPDPPHKSLLF